MRGGAFLDGKHLRLVCLPSYYTFTNYEHYYWYRTTMYTAFIMSAQWVCPFCLSVCPTVSIVQLQTALANMRCWPNTGLMLAHSIRRWASISPVLGYRVVFGATLNVGQRHRRRANINPALFQSIVLV